MNDLIDRQAAIDALEESRRLNHHQDGKAACAHEYEHRHFLKILGDLPSAQPERKKGRWVKHGTGHSIYYDCSLCGCVAPCTEVGDSFIWKLSTYCPDCGAKMGND